MENARLNAENNKLREATQRGDNSVSGQSATIDNADNGNHHNDCDNEANEDTGEGGRFTFPDMAAAPAAANIYHPTFKNVL
jgi:hypothetical protein